MTRERLIDAIRAEIKRQGRNRLSVVANEAPDTFYVWGYLDIHDLAKAILQVTGER